jgi:release factor glutamine methyltransferase
VKFLGEVLGLSVAYLKEKRVPSPRLAAETLLAHVLGKKRVDLYMQFECPLEEEELGLFRLLLKRAAALEPIEYITAETEFYGCLLKVSNKVLIPRPETEILVDKASEILEKDDLEGKVLFDVCTGSGCIGLSLKKKFPKLSAVLSDVSPEALEIAKENGNKNNLDVSFLEGDFLNPFDGKKADYVFCNPPYVTEGEYEGLDPSVKGYEPKLALVGGESGLVFYERLERELPSYLNPGAKVFLEIGFTQGESLKKVFSAPLWKNKQLIADFAGHDRFFFLEIE